MSELTVREFLDRYRVARLGLLQRQDLASNLARLLPELRAAKLREYEFNRLHAPEFNLFRILRLDHSEAAHSLFLGELLNPRGSHGQGTLFARSFLNIFKRSWHQSSANVAEANTGLHEISVQNEATIFQGRCDLLVRTSHLLVLIENKIDALEGDRQLSRYRRWLDSQQSERRETVLVFLTPDGRPSQDPEMRASDCQASRS